MSSKKPEDRSDATSTNHEANAAEKGILIGGIYPVGYSMAESPIIEKLGRMFSDFDEFVLMVWVSLLFRPEIRYDGMFAIDIYPKEVIGDLDSVEDRPLPDLDNCDKVILSLGDIPEPLRDELSALVRQDMKRFEADGTLAELAREIQEEGLSR